MLGWEGQGMAGTDSADLGQLAGYSKHSTDVFGWAWLRLAGLSLVVLGWAWLELARLGRTRLAWLG